MLDEHEPFEATERHDWSAMSLGLTDREPPSWLFKEHCAQVRTSREERKKRRAECRQRRRNQRDMTCVGG